MFDQEKWLPIAGYEGRYDVSNHGRVRSLMLRIGSRVETRDEPLTLRQRLGGCYFNITLTSADHKRTSHSIHRLVCETFNGPPPTPEHYATHDNGIPAQNHWKNIVWKTQKGNCEDKIRHGTHQFGERVGTHKLTELAALEILKDARKTPGPLLAKRYGVAHVSIYAVLNRKTWKHVQPMVSE